MNKKNYTKDYYLNEISEIENKMNTELNDALTCTYGAMCSIGTKSEFPIIFMLASLLSVAQIDYYLYKRNECYKKMENEEGMTEPIKLRKVIEYKRKQ